VAEQSPAQVARTQRVVSRLTSPRGAARVIAAAAIGSAVVFGVGACGAGQISQTANQEAAVNGGSATSGDLALRDVHVVYPAVNADDAFVNGGPFEVAFLISNNSPFEDDTLQSITVPGGGTATISGSKALPATKSLRAGEPSQLLTGGSAAPSAGVPSSEVAAQESEAGSAGNSADPSETRITVTLTGMGTKVRPGLTVPLEFTFQRAGKVTVNTPVDAGYVNPRRDSQFLNRENAEANEENAPSNEGSEGRSGEGNLGSNLPNTGSGGTAG
jgi:copper(I)-binding protein